MHRFPKLRDFLFRVRHCFRGVPFRIAGRTIRIDESLRRWDMNGESEVQQTLINHLLPGDCMLDIGANFGIHSLLGGSLVGQNGVVHAFEPLPTSLKMLRHHVRLNGLQGIIRVVASAVSDSKDPHVAFFGGAENVGTTASLRPSGSNTNRMTVANVTLDDYSRQLNRLVRLLKIDVEGGEVKVLRGGQEFFMSHRPLLIIEVHTFAFSDFGTSMQEYQTLLHDLGYKEEILPGSILRNGLHYQALYRPKTTD
jgi:FkbM family methyltransferase